MEPRNRQTGGRYEGDEPGSYLVVLTPLFPNNIITFREPLCVSGPVLRYDLTENSQQTSEQDLLLLPLCR